MSDSVQLHRWQPTWLLCPWDSPGKNTGVGCHFLLQRVKVKSESEVAQSCPTLSEPMDCSLPGSSTHGIFQARVLEWVAITFSGPEGSGFQTFESGNTSWRRWPRRWGLCPDPRTSPLFFCVQLGCHLEKRLPLLKEKNRIFKISSLLSSSL